MIKTSPLQQFLVRYKESFEQRWSEVKYKWQAVQCFQRNWNPEDADFAAMLERALEGTDRLPREKQYFPKKLFVESARRELETVHKMFRDFFDENIDVIPRINKAKYFLQMLCKESTVTKFSSFNADSVLSIFLWMRYPEKYYIYKFSVARALAKQLGSDHEIRKGAYIDNLRAFHALCEEVRAELARDTDLRALLEKHLMPDCHPDPELVTLTLDFADFVRTDGRKARQEMEPISIDSSCLQQFLARYGTAFRQRWPEVKYKWEAVQCFRKAWKPEASDFAAMFERALAKTDPLFSQQENMSWELLFKIVKREPDKSRSMFKALFYENVDVFDRVTEFKNVLRGLSLVQYTDVQKETIASICLWLCYPDKYYICKPNAAQELADQLGCGEAFRNNTRLDCLAAVQSFYDALRTGLAGDRALRVLLEEHLTLDCHPDRELVTLISDMADFAWDVSQAPKPVRIDSSCLQQLLASYRAAFERRWPEVKGKLEAVQCFRQAWNPDASDVAAMLGRALAKSDLLLSQANMSGELLTGFAKQAPEAVRAMFCTLFEEKKDLHARIQYFKRVLQNLYAKFTETKFVSGFHNELVASTCLWLCYPDKYYIYKPFIAKGLAEQLKTDISFEKDGYTENLAAFQSLYGALRAELAEDTALRALLEKHLTPDCYPDPEFVTLTIDMGEFVWENTREGKGTPEPVPAKEAERQPDPQPAGEKEPQISPELQPGQEAGLAAELRTRMLKVAAELQARMLRAGQIPSGPGPQPVPEPQATPGPQSVPEPQPEPYGKADFLKEVFLEEEKFDALAGVLRFKKNLILQGPPGVGKTFAARRLAHALMGVRDDSRIEFVQFHQSYSYEDFMMGYRPNGQGFELRKGLFYNFCKKAESQPDKEHFFLIDEINRGNLSRIFGELLMLIEKDYRGTSVTLAYTGESFSVPENLYLVGMMNTADRSLAMIDHALRRRFCFFDMEPGFASKGFRRYQASLGSTTFDSLITCIGQLNEEIAKDSSLGRGFRIGHSHFCGKLEEVRGDMGAWLRAVVEYDILPLLGEYWFDDQKKLEHWETRLRAVLK